MTAPLAGYLRVSARAGERDDQGKLHSPDWQRQKIERMGLHVVFHDPELDVSGSKTKRRILETILEGVENGTYSGIAIDKLDRLSRLAPRERIDLFERIETAGGTVVSASENIDPTTPEGRFARDVFLGVARMQWERYRDNYQRAKQHAHDQGMRLGPTPLGYTRTPEGKLAINKQEAELVRTMFHVCATEGMTATVRHYRAHAPTHKTGKRAGKHRNITHDRTRYIITNRVYLGEERFAGFPTITAWPAIVTQLEFDAAQSAIQPTHNRAPSAKYPLSGLLDCGTCGTHMTGARGYDNRRCYRCTASYANHRGKPCPGPVVIVADNIENHLRELLAASVSDRALEQIDSTDYDTLAEQAAADRAELEAFVIHVPATTPGYAEGITARETRASESEARRVQAAATLTKRGQIILTPDAILGSDGPTLRALVTNTGIRPTVLRSGRGTGHRLSLADRVVFPETADNPSATMPAG